VLLFNAVSQKSGFKSTPPGGKDPQKVFRVGQICPTLKTFSGSLPPGGITFGTPTFVLRFPHRLCHQWGTSFARCCRVVGKVPFISSTPMLCDAKTSFLLPHHFSARGEKPARCTHHIPHQPRAHPCRRKQRAGSPWSAFALPTSPRGWKPGSSKMQQQNQGSCFTCRRGLNAY